jgi:Cu(I)/Ag(I) efflux system membrane fusion protein
MDRKVLSLIRTTFVTFALAGCSDSNDGSATDGAVSGMPGVQQAAPNTAVHAAEGTVNSVDLTARTVNLSHGPVASANWPAMTMSFTLPDSEAAANLRPGQKVKFRFTIQSGMAATVTEIAAAD